MKNGKTPADMPLRAATRLGTIVSVFLLSVAICPASDFPAELYPQLKDKTEEQIRLAGVAALCPGRILPAKKPAERPVPELRKPRVAELPRGGAFVRLYAPSAEAVREHVGKNPLVVDCRYLRTEPGDLDAVLALASALNAGTPPSVRPIGDYPKPSAATTPTPATVAHTRPPVLVLVNSRTAGPLEAALAALQTAGAIHLVGTRTEGATGVHNRILDTNPPMKALTGEIRPTSGESLVGVGASPRFPVKISAEEEFAAWQLVERGTPLAGVLPRDSAGKTTSAKPGTDPKSGVGKTVEAELPVDTTLARAQDILVALRVLDGVK